MRAAAGRASYRGHRTVSLFSRFFGTPSYSESGSDAHRQAEEDIVGRLGGDAAIAIGVLAICLTVLNGADETTAILISVTGSIALTLGFVMRFRPGRIPLPYMDGLEVMAAGMLLVISRYGGPVRPALPGIYVLIGTILFAVRALPVSLAHYAVMGASYAGVLWIGPHENAPVTRWFGVMAAVAVSGGFIRWLVNLGSRLAISEHEARATAERSGAELAEQSVAKSTFIARMSHELRTPLNVVLGFSDLLSERVAGPLTERQQSYVGDICSAARHLVDLVNDVLSLTSVEAGVVELETEPNNIGAVLHEAVRLVQSQAETARVTVRVDLAPSLRSVEIDSRKVRQVVVNLLTNAIKFSPRGATVTATARNTAAGVRVTVRDEGTGIAPAESDQIFEQYTTSQSATAGTGLGLPLSRRIIEAHGGMLTLVHSAIDVGSVFAFELLERVQPPKGAPVSVLESVATKPEYSAFTEPGSMANLGLIVVVGTWFSWIAAIIEVVIAAVTPLSAHQRIGILILAAANALSATLVRLLGHRLKLIGIHTWGAIGTVIISVGVYYSGSFIDIVPLVYGWVPMVAFALWNRRPAILHVAIVMACYATVLNLRPFHQRASLWLMVMTIICFNAAVVTLLTDRLRNLVITEQLARRTAERVRAELATTTAHKSDFLANMSHELRTPLNAIVGFADLLHSEVGGPLSPRQSAYVEDIRSAASRLTSIINDVLDLAKLEAHRFQIDVELIALAPMFDRVLSRARSEAAGKVEVFGSIEPGLEFITADAMRIEQVLSNLAINGVKFTPMGGQVSLTAHRSGGNVTIDITDTGIGIQAEQQARIFDPFHQGTRMIGDRLPEGTGLGLTLAKNLIELHGGRITLSSEPDHGSTFTIDLPIRPPNPRAPVLATIQGGAL